MNEPLAEGNIQLEYRLKVVVPAHNLSFNSDGAEVFMDEQGVQWIKFFSKNGYDAGKEHMMRTDQIWVVKS